MMRAFARASCDSLAVDPPRTTGGFWYLKSGPKDFPWDPYEWRAETGIAFPMDLGEVASACERYGYCPSQEIIDAGFTIDAARMVLRNFLLHGRKHARGTDPNSPRQKKRTRRPAIEKNPRPLTPRQTEVMQIVGECKGNFAQAARQIGLNRKTVEQHYIAATKKLGMHAVRAAERKPKAPQRLPEDHRQQVDAFKNEDGQVRPGSAYRSGHKDGEN
jgi:DNA-binding CsgD family transcriptional regulator